METRTELCGINKIIDSIDQEQPNLNPTQIYNEGWMTRLLVKFSIEDKLKFKGIDFYLNSVHMPLVFRGTNQKSFFAS